MLQFLNPIWFFGVAAIAIPVIIHLWNIRPGRVLKVGSISLIDEASRKSSRSFKLNDILLFIIRCLFLLLLVTLLALPFIRQRLAIKKSKGWVLVPKENFNQGYKAFKKSIDSLLQAGYEFHFFNDSLPKTDLVKMIKDKAVPADSAAHIASDYWGLIKQLDAKVAADVPVYLYTSGSIDHFKGEKPAADLDLHWQTYTDADSTAQWIENAWFTNNKDARVVKGTSNKGGIDFTYTTLPPDKGNSELKINLQNGKAIVSLAGKKDSNFTVTDSALKIAIYTDHFQPDAGYLKAALDAAIGFNQRQSIIKQYSNVAAIPNNQTWIFWLSEQPLPARLLQKGVNILTYQKGKQNLIATSIAVGNTLSLPAGEQQVTLFKIAGFYGNDGDIIWHDGFGNAVLSSTIQNGAVMYKLSSHLSPAWNDLVWDSSFPRIILQLLNNNLQKDISSYDKRTLSTVQIQPAKTTDKNVISDKFLARKDLVNYFWYALALVFLIERWLATSTKFAQSNG